MKFRLALWLFLLGMTDRDASAHLGSPDVFYSGEAGIYPVNVVIRMPGVVPGRAQINVEVDSAEPVTVSFAPISSRTAISNMPPAEIATRLANATNSFQGELWLMTSGAYTILINVVGKTGAHSVQIPVNSVATTQLPLPRALGITLFILALILVSGAIAIVASAAGESTSPAGATVTRDPRKFRRALIIMTLISLALVTGGWKWWKADEREFRQRLREGGWPDMKVEIGESRANHFLEITLAADGKLDLAPDHGKILHFFLVREPGHDAFAHLHPYREGDNTFRVAVPPLPEGNYQVFCDLTLSDSGLSSTATNRVNLPPPDHSYYKPTDADDTWVDDPAFVPSAPNQDAICTISNLAKVVWKAHRPLHAHEDAALRFEVRRPDGAPAALEPYMGMMCHAVIMRSDDKVFAHLHPFGNYAMAAQLYFDKKMSAEGLSGKTGVESICGPGGSGSEIVIPYQFPSPGEYRIWAEFITGGKIVTGVFDTLVQ